MYHRFNNDRVYFFCMEMGDKSEKQMKLMR